MTEPSPIGPAIQRVDQVRHLVAASGRALSAHVGLHFRGARLYDGAGVAPVRAAHVAGHLPVEDGAASRAVADAVGLRLRFSDEARFVAALPDSPIARVLFEFAEQVRVESLCPVTLPGAARNLEYLFARWARHAVAGGLTETDLGLHLLTVALVIRSRVGATAIDSDYEDLIEGTRFTLAAEIGAPLKELRRLRHDQRGYQVPAAQIANAVAARFPGSADHDGQEADDEHESLRELGFVPLVDSREELLATAARSGADPTSPDGASYTVFSTAYDRLSTAAELGRPAQLSDWLAQIRAVPWPVSPRAVARRLEPTFAAPSPAGWGGGYEEGLLDSSRLTSLVTGHADPDLFRRPVQAPRSQAHVTLLLDCSGSMRRHNTVIAALCNLLGRALDLIDVPLEVLGFSTVDWHGGRSARDWTRSGSPARPGRLGGVHHVVFKDADTRWQRGHAGLGAMLRPDLYREGVDGEALGWALSRIGARNAARRVVIVLSDGGPMETATRDVNPPGFLDDHLLQVAAQCENDGLVELHGVGVEADVSTYYRSHGTVCLDDGLTKQVVGQLVALLGAPATG